MPFWSDLLGPRQRFDGGLFLPEHKSAIARRPVEKVEIDGPLHIPLQVHREAPTQIAVASGDRVLGGQALALPANADSVPVYAPTSGHIAAVRRVWTVADGDLPGVVLEPDGRDEWLPRSRSWLGESFMGQLADCGVVCPAPRGPAHRVIRQALAANTTDLIINAMETEPYLAADLRTLVEEPGRLMDTTCEIASAVGARRVILALPYRHRRVVKRLEQEARGRFVEVAPLSNRFPQCNPVVLVKTLLDRDVPPGGSPFDVGACVLPLAAVRAAAAALMDGRPVTRTVITVGGDAVDRPGTYNIAVGTPIRRVAERVGLVGPVVQAVWGGPLTGLAIRHDDAVVTADTTALLLFSTAPEPNPVPCIHCGWCVEDCPVGLNPSELMDLEAEETCDDTELARLQVCVECGLCSYVCPAQLPLAASIRRARTRFVRAAAAAATVRSP